MTTTDAPALHETGMNLSTGDNVLVNDRERALTVTGQHSRERRKKYRRAAGDYTVIELEGNGTEYHLLCWTNASHGPMLYMQRDWERTKTETGDERYEYPRGGTRVETITVT